MDIEYVVCRTEGDLRVDPQRLDIYCSRLWSGPETGSFSLVSPGFGPTPESFFIVSSIQPCGETLRWISLWRLR